MKGRIIADWGKVNMETAEGRGQVLGALQHFLGRPEDPKVKSALQHFSFGGDFPAEVKPYLDKILLLEPVDTGYEGIFDIRDFTTTKADGFKIPVVQSGITFSEVKPGEKARIYQVSGDELTVSFAMYGAGLGWHRKLIDDGRFWDIEDNIAAARAAYYAKRAETFYGLIEAISASYNVAWQSPTPAALPNTDARYVVSRDANTIHTACLAVMGSMKTYGIGPNSPLRLLAPLALKNRIRAALAYSEPLAGNMRVLDWNIQPIFTQNLTTNQTDYYVGVPGLTAKGGNRMNLTPFYDADPTAYTDMMVGWARWGAGIGNQAQFRRCASA